MTLLVGYRNEAAGSIVCKNKMREEVSTNQSHNSLCL